MVNEIVVLSFREVMSLILFLEISQSAITPNAIDDIHIAMYGSDVSNPLDFTSNFKTSFIYFGRSVTTAK